jgi:hypothetical protein
MRVKQPKPMVILHVESEDSAALVASVTVDAMIETKGWRHEVELQQVTSGNDGLRVLNRLVESTAKIILVWSVLHCPSEAEGLFFLGIARTMQRNDGRITRIVLLPDDETYRVRHAKSLGIDIVQKTSAPNPDPAIVQVLKEVMLEAHAKLKLA